MSEQLTFEDLWFAEEDFRTFISRLEAYRSEIARLNEEIGTLRLEYSGLLPVKHLETAYGIEAKRQRLAEHPKEPLDYAGQRRLEALVRAHLETRARETREALEALREGRGVPDMGGGTAPQAKGKVGF
jgi:hypothetical protein